MRTAFKYFVSRTYKPILEKYLSKKRHYSYRGINVAVFPGVFHPGFFFSTKMLLNFINGYSLHQKSVLELGAGTGLISMYAAKEGAQVTASDISSLAVKNLEDNRVNNAVSMKIIHSDLFQDIPIQNFDLIAINPPYYKRKPKTQADYAWCCGENGEYFERLFAGLPSYIHPESIICMVLCDGCDLEMIGEMARKNGFRFHCEQTSQNLLEKNFIYKIEQER